MKWNAFSLVSPAIDKTEKKLFPFVFKEWIRLVFISMLSKFGSTGGGFKGNMLSNLGSSNSTSKAKNITGAAIAGTASTLGFGLIGLMLLILLGLGIFMVYITSVFSFIYIYALTNKKYLIKEGWTKNKKLGSSLFWFRILLGIICLLMVIIIFIIPVLNVIHIGFSNYFTIDNILKIFLDFLPYVLIFLVWAIILWIFTTLVYDFSLIEMYKRRIGAWTAIKNTLREAKKQKLEILVYLIAKIIIAIGMSIILIISAIILLVPGVIIAIGLAFVSVPLLIVFIMLYLIAMVCTIIIALLPLSVFRGYFSIMTYEKVYSNKILN